LSGKARSVFLRVQHGAVAVAGISVLPGYSPSSDPEAFGSIEEGGATPGGLVRRKWQVKTGFVENITKTGICQVSVEDYIPDIEVMSKNRTFTNPWKNLLLCLFNHRLAANEPSEGKYPEASAGHALCHLFELMFCNSTTRILWKHMETVCLSTLHTGFTPNPSKLNENVNHMMCIYIYIYCRYNHYVTCVYIYM